MPRHRNAKILATLGPASATKEILRDLYEAGVDVFRLNFSHGTHEDHLDRIRMIREIESEVGCPIGILGDLQGPKLRVGIFQKDAITLETGQTFQLDLSEELGNAKRVKLPHPEIYKAAQQGTLLLLDDGKLQLEVTDVRQDCLTTIVRVGGKLSNNKGVNVPGAQLPISALTEKDLIDLEFALSHSVDWIALSFVQCPEDILAAKKLIGNQAKVLAKLEKPLAIDHLEPIIELSDAIMVARGDLGVELPLEDVPSIQKRIIRSCREAGKPVVVATQMLDSMVHAPSPTRAETSDVATAIYDGVDAVMLSAESASGSYPVEAVSMMNRIIERVEQDPVYRQMIEAARPYPQHTTPDAITAAARIITETIPIVVTVTFTESGSTTLRAARERPESPIIGMTPTLQTARMLCMVWGVHAVVSGEISSFTDMVSRSCHAALHEAYAHPGDDILIIAGVPFGQPGSTNVIRVAKVEKDFKG